MTVQGGMSRRVMGSAGVQLLLWLVSFTVGGAVMIIELAGARLLAPTFGASVVPWTAAISVILLGVALGNAWGGRRSRRGGAAGLRVLLVAAALATLLPLVRMDLPGALLGFLGPIAGSVASALVLFLPAAFLMGAAVPLLVQLATDDLAEVGRRAGSLNGANAAGAIVGTLGAGFVLIPLMPISYIFLITSLTLGGTVLLASLPSVAGTRG